MQTLNWKFLVRMLEINGSMSALSVRPTNVRTYVHFSTYVDVLQGVRTLSYIFYEFTRALKPARYVQTLSSPFSLRA